MGVQNTQSKYSRKIGVSNIYAPTSVFIKDFNDRSLKKIIDNKKHESGYYPIDWSPDNNWILVTYSFPHNLGLDYGSVKNQFFYNVKNKKLYKLKIPSKFSEGKFIGWNQKDTNTVYLVTKKELWTLDFDRIAKKRINQKTIENTGPFQQYGKKPIGKGAW